MFGCVCVCVIVQRPLPRENKKVSEVGKKSLPNERIEEEANIIIMSLLIRIKDGRAQFSPTLQNVS